jgi:hypothetical protein
MKELTLALLMWIGGHTSMTVGGSDAPQVVQIDQHQLVRILYDGNLPQGLDIDSVTVEGLYNFRDGNIYLSKNVDLTTPAGRAVLVHELVHYLQYQRGLDQSVPCMRALEPPAYAAQAEYLKQHGGQPLFNTEQVLAVSTCTPPSS